MIKYVIAIVLFVLAGFLFFFYGAGFRTPEKTLEFAINSAKNNNQNEFFTALTEGSAEKIKEGFEGIKANILSYENSDLKRIEESNDRVVMKSQKDGRFLVFVKEKNKWKIDLELTFEKMLESNF